ncbi:MAG: hypothetical protein AB1489_37555 [Acidobacteriota bacterium]
MAEIRLGGVKAMEEEREVTLDYKADAKKERLKAKIKPHIEDNGEIKSSLPHLPALERLTEEIKEQIQGHYIASLVYKDMEKNLVERQRLVQEWEGKLDTLNTQLKLLRSSQEESQAQLTEILIKQEKCRQEYETDVQQLDQVISEIDEQIAELERRKGEIIEQKQIQFHAYEESQTPLKNDIEQLQNQLTSLSDQHKELKQQIQLLSRPEELINLDSRISDLVYHICSIFQTPQDNHPDAALAMKETSPGLVVPPIFKLHPWTMGENKELTDLVIPLGAKQLIICLQLPGEIHFERYSAELYASNGRRVWNDDKLEGSDRIVMLTFNATFFLSDYYELRLKGRSTDRKYTAVGEYYFQINKT